MSLMIFVLTAALVKCRRQVTMPSVVELLCRSKRLVLVGNLIWDCG